MGSPNTVVARVTYWLPRCLGLLLVVVVCVLALGVFGSGFTLWGTLTALVIHLAPAWVLLVVLAVAWRWEWAGGVVYLALGVLFASAGRASGASSLVVAGPLALTGALFLLDWALRGRMATGKGDFGDA
jgi:hypothetical protein